jgi:hypothetical protein
VSTNGASSQAALPQCYDLTFGRWSARSGRLYEPLPRRIALTDRVHSAGEGYTTFEVVRWPADTNAWSTTWRPAGPDSVLVTLAAWWSTGVQITFTRSHNALVGDAAVYTDASPNRNPHAPVRATRVPCPASVTIGKRGA